MRCSFINIHCISSPSGPLGSCFFCCLLSSVEPSPEHGKRSKTHVLDWEKRGYVMTRMMQNRIKNSDVSNVIETRIGNAIPRFDAARWATAALHHSRPTNRHPPILLFHSSNPRFLSQLIEQSSLDRRRIQLHPLSVCSELVLQSASPGLCLCQPLLLGPRCPFGRQRAPVEPPSLIAAHPWL